MHFWVHWVTLSMKSLKFQASCLTEFTTLVDQCFHVIITNERGEINNIKNPFHYQTFRLRVRHIVHYYTAYHCFFFCLFLYPLPSVCLELMTRPQSWQWMISNLSNIFSCHSTPTSNGRTEIPKTKTIKCSNVQTHNQFSITSLLLLWI